jgi:hypothetical protein
MPTVVLNWTLLKKGVDVTTHCAEEPGQQASLTGCRQAVKIADSNRMDALSYPWKSYIPKAQQWESLERARIPPPEAKFVRIDKKLTGVRVLESFTNLKAYRSVMGRKRTWSSSHNSLSEHERQWDASLNGN